MTIDDIMADLKTDYLDSLPFKVEELKKKIEAKEKDSVVDLFHQIKGSGKTYGFAELSTIAEKAEQQIPKANEWLKEAKNHVNALEKVYENLISGAA